MDRDEVIERILLAAEAIPPGQVLAYGDIAAIVGCGPRQVGTIMRTHGHQVPWWRVTSHSGDLARGLLARAQPMWEEEGIEIKPNGLGCRIAIYRADRDAVAEAVETAFAAELEEAELGADPGR